MRPPVFAELSLEAARSSARDRFLIIDFTASWCGPCKMMDKNTWVDASVVEWLKAHAVALQLDVDVDAAAKQFEVRAMPTVVALKADTEVDRIVGYRNPQQLLQWLNDLLQGKTDLDRARERLDGDDLSQRFELAQTLSMRGKADEAVEHYVWLWEHSLEKDPAWVGVRHSFLIRAMQEVGQASPRARAVLVGLRDAAERGSGDWISLNEAVDEEDVTLAWFDEVKASGKRAPHDVTLERLLRERERWKDFGEMIDDPVKSLGRQYDGLAELDGELGKSIPAEQLAEVRQVMLAGARAEADALVRALKAAGRDADAEAVLAEKNRRDPVS